MMRQFWLFLTGDSGKAQLTSGGLLLRATCLAILIALVLLGITGLIYVVLR